MPFSLKSPTYIPCKWISYSYFFPPPIHTESTLFLVCFQNDIFGTSRGLINRYYFRLFFSLLPISNGASFYCNHYYYYYCYCYSLLSLFFLFFQAFPTTKMTTTTATTTTVCQFYVGVISNRILRTVLWRIRAPRINLVFAKLRLRYFNDRRHTTVASSLEVYNISVHPISRRYIIIDNNRFAYLI